MKVLLIGATGNLGIRLVPALLSHGHKVTAYVRSASKLQGLLPSPVFSLLTAIEGDARDSSAIIEAILSSGSEAVVNTAGLAAMFPWGATDLPDIFKAVVQATREAGKSRGSPLRVWMLGGMTALQYPGTNNVVAHYFPMVKTHIQDLELLQSVPESDVQWSMLCPADMTADGSEPTVPTQTFQQSNLVANATYPALWQGSWLENIPFVGRTIVLLMNFMRYRTTLESVAEFIASDINDSESRWVGKAVGVIDGAK